MMAVIDDARREAQEKEDEIRVTKSLRYRINISRGMKGQVSYEATVDGEGWTREHILEESDMLVQELNRRYPAEVSEKK